MEKKLPEIFANKIEKEINNNERVYISSKQNEENKSKKNKEDIKYEKTIEQKISEILKNKKNLYKIPVKIKMNNEETLKNIIGRNKKTIITIENELIPIDKIEDIKIYNE